MWFLGSVPGLFIVTRLTIFFSSVNSASEQMGVEEQAAGHPS